MKKGQTQTEIQTNFSIMTKHLLLILSLIASSIVFCSFATGDIIKYKTKSAISRTKSKSGTWSSWKTDKDYLGIIIELNSKKKEFTVYSKNGTNKYSSTYSNAIKVEGGSRLSYLCSDSKKRECAVSFFIATGGKSKHLDIVYEDFEVNVDYDIISK